LGISIRRWKKSLFFSGTARKAFPSVFLVDNPVHSSDYLIDESWFYYSQNDSNNLFLQLPFIIANEICNRFHGFIANLKLGDIDDIENLNYIYGDFYDQTHFARNFIYFQYDCHPGDVLYLRINSSIFYIWSYFGVSMTSKST